MPIRKPHNMVTTYWDDMRHFLMEAEQSERIRARYDSFYTLAISKIEDSEDFKNKVPNLPTFERRGIRYTILSSFLFL